jgi:pimeloyl-ACP methyl ester carboxylesterase
MKLRFEGVVTLLQLFAIAWLLTGCAGNGPMDESFGFSIQSRLAPTETAMALARESGMRWRYQQAGRFEIAVAARRIHETGPITFYIEGDGRPWATRYRVSRDPSPRKPVALQLATRDPSPNVVYLARPCHFLDDESLADCDPRYWTSHRYSAAVVESLSAAIDEILRSRHSDESPGGAKARFDTPIRLVGFSGGGTLAALLAAHRSDVEHFVTVAGNLDPDAWTTVHDLTPLEGSLSPTGFLARLSLVEQTHFLGKRDDNVATATIAPYRDGLSADAPVRWT